MVNLLGFISALFQPASELGKQYIEGKYRIQEAKISAEVAKYTTQATAYENEAVRTHDWEMVAIEQMKYSWKDEFWTIIFGAILVIPMVAAVAGYGEEMQIAWDAYKDMPLVFQFIIPAMALASVGIRYRGKQNAADAIRSLPGPKIEAND